MATTDRVKEALSQFLACDEPGVFAIKGDWGVGKTYFWHRYVKEETPAMNCRAYAYVSLFGITSVAELRRAIFARQAAYGGGGKALLTKAVKGGSLLLKGMKGGVQGTNFGLEGTEAWSDMVEEHLLKDFLVCIDDLERKEENLSPSALLGFIANLRDERQCKVVLLYNDDKFDEQPELAECMAEYREKVIDRELTYQPTVADSYRLVFGDSYRFKKPKDSPSNPFHPSEKRSLLEIFESVETANIRVMRKAKDILNYCAPHMAKKCPNLWPSFARQVVKVSCLYYVHGRSFNIEDVTDAKSWAHILMARDSAKDEAQKKKYAVVDQVGYFQMGCDTLILEYLRLGYIDWAGHTKLLAQQEKEHAMSHLGMRLHLVWELIWSNFSTDQTIFCRDMNSFISKHGPKMSLAEISQAVSVMREFEGAGTEAEVLLKKKVEQFVAKAGRNATSQLHYGGIAPVAADMIRERVSLLDVKKTLPEVIEAMSHDQKGYDPADVRYLQHCTVDEFYEYIRTSKRKEFLRELETFQGRTGNDETGKIVRERYDQAIKRLAQESKINARRVRYGLKIKIPGVTPD